MLRRIHIRNIALITEQAIEFDDGFSVLTGETGAGKSIIIESFNFVLGERASRELIKYGAQKASAEAVFVISETEPAAATRPCRSARRSSARWNCIRRTASSCCTANSARREKMSAA